MEPNAKLFRAIVILGAALTAPACEGGKCGPNALCTPPPDATASNDGRVLVDAGSPVDADTSDVILII